MNALEDSIVAVVRQAVRDELGVDRTPAAFTIEGSARYIGTSPQAIRALIGSGELRCLRVGARTYVGRAVLDALLARGATVTLAETGETS